MNDQDSISNFIDVFTYYKFYLFNIFIKASYRVWIITYEFNK